MKQDFSAQSKKRSKNERFGSLTGQTLHNQYRDGNTNQNFPSMKILNLLIYTEIRAGRYGSKYRNVFSKEFEYAAGRNPVPFKQFLWSLALLIVVLLMIGMFVLVGVVTICG